MPSLSIKNFSCIDSADFKLGKLTVIIGPQGAGKSIICKLMHYFIDISSIAFRNIEEGGDLDSLQKKLIEIFKSKFPHSAWGEKLFQIEFISNDIIISISRTRSNKNLSKNIRIKFSDNFIENYNKILATYLAQPDFRRSRDDLVDSPVEREEWWKLRRALRARWHSFLERHWARNQVFIPAGRAFFTTLGKAVSAFEQGGMLDDITIKFGGLFVALRDRGAVVFPPRKNVEGGRIEVERALFGGKIKLDPTRPHVEAIDGRRIPLSIMSSGQQELLPLWIVMGYVNEFEREGSIVYIEEPEAHLFPESQSVLVQYLSSTISSGDWRSMVISTHSPYVLAKLNNLIQAGKLFDLGSRAISLGVSKIIPRESALGPGRVEAYAIIDRVLKPILDEDGLIDGEYLDKISGFLGEEFDRLLDLEPDS